MTNDATEDSNNGKTNESDGKELVENWRRGGAKETRGETY